MTNHIHLIVNANEPFILKDTIRDLKKFISKKVIKQILDEPESRREWMIAAFEKNATVSKRYKNYKFWKTGNHAIELYNYKFTWDKVLYIHDNPVKDKYASKPEDWKYSSASNYANLPSLIEPVTCLSQPLSVVKSNYVRNKE
jgi:putative transposase